MSANQGANIISIYLAVSGLLSAVIMVVIGQKRLQPSLLASHSERELRMARWRQWGAALLEMWCAGNMALFFQDLHQLLYLRLVGPACPAALVLCAMNMPLLWEAARVLRERRQASKAARISR